MEDCLVNISRKLFDFRAWALVATVLIISGSAKAQIASPIYHPNDVIKISVTFEGKDAERISHASAELKTADEHSDQLNFTGDFTGESTDVPGAKTFEILVKVPANATSGTYKLVNITAYVRDLNINITYVSPADFKALTYVVENASHLVKPTIKDVR